MMKRILIAFAALCACLGTTHAQDQSKPAIFPQLGHSLKPESFHDWAASDFDTYAGRLGSLQAVTLILLPIAAAAFGMTAFGIAFLIVEHGGV